MPGGNFNFAPATIPNDSGQSGIPVDWAFLEGIALFEDVDIAAAIRQRPFEKESPIPVQDAAAGRITVVAQGMVRVEWNLGDGRRQVLGFGLRGDVLLEPCEQPGVCTIAVTPGMLYQLDVEGIAGSPERRREIEAWALAVTRNSLAAMAARVATLGRLTALERVASFLLELAERTGGPNNGGTRVALPMCRGDIADYLGLNVETVSRQFSELKRKGVLAMPKPGYAVVSDMDALAALSPLASRLHEGSDIDTA